MQTLSEKEKGTVEESVNYTKLELVEKPCVMAIHIVQPDSYTSLTCTSQLVN